VRLGMPLYTFSGKSKIVSLRYHFIMCSYVLGDTFDVDWDMEF